MVKNNSFDISEEMDDNSINAAVESLVYYIEFYFPNDADDALTPTYYYVDGTWGTELCQSVVFCNTLYSTIEKFAMEKSGKYPWKICKLTNRSKT